MRHCISSLVSRTLSCLLIPALLLSALAGCSPGGDKTTTQTCETILRILLHSAGEYGGGESPDQMHLYCYDALRQPGYGQPEDYCDAQEMKQILADFYGLDDCRWYDAAIVRQEGASAFELAVLAVPEEIRQDVAVKLQEYRENRRADFTGYLPEEAERVDQGRVLTCGNHVALLISETPDALEETFQSCFGNGAYAEYIPEFVLPRPEILPNGRYAFVDPGQDDMTPYDTSAILEAWKSGDRSALSEEDSAILEKAEQVLNGQITPGMSDGEKEFALYRWVTENVVYDQRHYDREGAPRTSYGPGGPLLEGTGVCLGFASCFQLLMDMAGLECITVTGGAYYSRENHAWNMVRLDGAWYCADPTWDVHPPQEDDTVYCYSYFNVTSDFMAESDHQWDYDAVPEAVTQWDGIGAG